MIVWRSKGFPYGEAVAAKAVTEEVQQEFAEPEQKRRIPAASI